MTEGLNKERQVELLGIIVFNERRINSNPEEVVNQLLKDENISQRVRDSVRAALGIAKLDGFILGKLHDDGEEVTIDGKSFEELMGIGKLLEPVVSMWRREDPRPQHNGGGT